MVTKQILINVLKNYLEAKNYTIKMAPDTIEYAGQRADLEASKEKEKLCFEVVNGTNIDTESIRQRLQAISGNNDCDFGLFTTKDKKKQIQDLLKKWNIDYRFIWIYNPDAK